MATLEKCCLVLGLISTLNLAYGEQKNTSQLYQDAQDAWVKQALRLQREIDLNAPLDQATFLGTHNSYNAKAYQNYTGRYIDPNQVLSITDQLNAGIRLIEYDVHWTLSTNFKYDLLLCHGEQSLGCSVFDRKVTEGLIELRDWLSANPDEVVILYIENFLNGHEALMTDLLKTYFGDFIYQPSFVRDNPAQSCVSLPGALTKASILKQGKQLLIATQGCYARPGEAFHDYVFAGMGNVPKHEYTFFEVNFDQFDIDHCGENNFADDFLHHSLWRTYEDRTKLSNLIHKNKLINAADMARLEKCDVNLPSLDMLQTNDDRLKAAIWSWAPNYPQPNIGNCAAYKKEIGIINKPCDEIGAGFVCRDSQDNTLTVISYAGNWQKGEAICQEQSSNWHFSTPINAHEMLSIQQVTPAVDNVWLNYNNQHGHWVVNN